MLKNYFKIAWRNFFKEKIFSVINLAGLAVALTSVILIASYVKYELSFDKHFVNSKRIYRLVAEEKIDGEFQETFTFPLPLVYTLKNEFPEIEAVSHLNAPKQKFILNNHEFSLDYLEVDSSFFQMFNFDFIYGNPRTALKNDHSIVLTQSASGRIFPNEIPMGKTISFKNYSGTHVSYTITGIIKNIPANTHFKTNDHFNAEAIAFRNTKTEPLNWHAFSSAGEEYLMLKKGVDVKSFTPKILSIYKKYDFPKDVHIILQPIQSIHLNSHIKNEFFANSDIKYVYIFSLIAFLILSIACINYINLSIARSLQRVKEVGMRKVMGANKKQLSVQFISESILFFLGTLPFVWIIAYLFWPFFSKLMEINLPPNNLFQWRFIVFTIAACIITGIISGAYPSFFLSRLKPVSLLKDWQKGFSLNMKIRKTLIVFQFFISISLIISTIIIYKQIHLLNNVNLGYDKENLIMLPSQSMDNKGDYFKNELKSGKDILDVSFAGWNPQTGYAGRSSMTQPVDTVKDWNFGFLYIDNDFLKTMKIHLLKGRNFGIIDHITDSINSKKQLPFMERWSSKPIIITKTTAKILGLKEPIVGQILKYSALQGTVIGVIDDFIGVSLLEKNPMVVLKNAENNSFATTYIKVNSKNTPETIEFIKSKYKKVFLDKNFDFSFVDEQIAMLYKSQQRLASLFFVFAFLAILIASIGLLSLVAITLQQKTKEIGIRKVLGAGIKDIIALLSHGFIKLILIAFIIASAVEWWAMNKWLQDFQYRVAISWWIFIITGIACIGWVLMLIFFQAFKVSKTNPVESLRSE